MATERSHSSGAPADSGAGYERRDAHVPALLQFGFWLAVLLVVTLVGMKWTFSYFSRTEPLGPAASPLIEPGARVLPPSPRLQSRPHQELKDYCEAQQEKVNTYAWVDQQSGVVRVPVDRAMDLVLAKGLPARAASEAPAGSPAAASSVPAAPDAPGQCGYLAPASSGESEK
jgi:hypothetical protein